MKQNNELKQIFNLKRVIKQKILDKIVTEFQMLNRSRKLKTIKEKLEEYKSIQRF